MCKIGPLLQNVLRRAGWGEGGQPSSEPPMAVPTPESGPSCIPTNNIIGWAMMPDKVGVMHYFVCGLSLCYGAGVWPVTYNGVCPEDRFTITPIPVYGKACTVCRQVFDQYTSMATLIEQYKPKPNA